MRPIDLLSSVIPDELTLKRLLIRFPFLAAAIMPILTSAACNFVPPAQAQTGAQPESPTTVTTDAPIPTNKDYGVVIDDSVDNTAKVLLTVEAEATSEPTPTITNTPEPPPTDKVPESMTKIVFNTIVNKRLGPGTNYETHGSYKIGEELDFSKIVEKLESGGLTWLRHSDNTWVALVPGVSYDAMSVKDLPTASLDSIPVAPTRTPTRVPPKATPQPVLPVTEVAPTPASIEVVGPSSQIFGGKGVEGHPLYATPYDLGNGGCSISPWVSGQSFSLGSIVTGSMTWSEGAQEYEKVSFLPKIDFTALTVDEVSPQADGTIILKVSGDKLIKITNRTRVVLGTTNHQNNPGYVDTGIDGPIQRFFVKGNLLGFHILLDGTVDYVFAKYPR